jgi:uncharacterized protein
LISTRKSGPAHNSSNPLPRRALSRWAVINFFFLAFLLSWAIGLVATQVQPRFPALSTALMMAAGFGPSVAGFAVVAVFGSGTGLRNWLARCLNWRLGWRWFALAFLLPPVVMLLALAIDGTLGGATPTWPAASRLPLVIANFGLVFLVGGPLGEEFGWRGYAMPALTGKLGWRSASLIVGAVWGLWHLPLFFLASSAQSHMPIPLFLLNILAGSVVFGWLFERTEQSVLPALVLHTSLNAWAGILGIVPVGKAGGSYAVVTGLLVLIALALLYRTNTTVNMETGPMVDVS